MNDIWVTKVFRERKKKTEILDYITFTKKQKSKTPGFTHSPNFGKRKEENLVLLTRLNFRFYNYLVKLIAWTQSYKPKKGKYIRYFS